MQCFSLYHDFRFLLRFQFGHLLSTFLGQSFFQCPLLAKLVQGQTEEQQNYTKSGLLGLLHPFGPSNKTAQFTLIYLWAMNVVKQDFTQVSSNERVRELKLFVSPVFQHHHLFLMLLHDAVALCLRHGRLAVDKFPVDEKTTKTAIRWRVRCSTFDTCTKRTKWSASGSLSSSSFLFKLDTPIWACRRVSALVWRRRVKRTHSTTSASCSRSSSCSCCSFSRRAAHSLRRRANSSWKHTATRELPKLAHSSTTTTQYLENI